jgi:cytosine/uracil/thiamine/allantoin permease
MFLWFRPRLELFWKIVATLIFIFYVWFFWDELSRGYNAFQAAWFDVTMHFLKELLSLVFVNLFLFWPIALLLIFYKADEVGAERLLKFMCVLTIVLWIIFVIYAYYHRGIDVFLFEKLKKMVPGAR